MPQRDITTGFYFQNALDLQTISTDTTTVGEIIDCQGFDRGMNFIIRTGTVTDGDYAALVEESDSPTFATSNVVPDNELVPADPSNTSDTPEEQASFNADDEDNITRKIGYVGSKRYVRLSIVSTNTSSGALITAIAMGHPNVRPSLPTDYS